MRLLVRCAMHLAYGHWLSQWYNARTRTNKWDEIFVCFQHQLQHTHFHLHEMFMFVCNSPGQKLAQKIASWTWDVTHKQALSLADLFGGKALSQRWCQSIPTTPWQAPVGALVGLVEQICWRICSSSALLMCLCGGCVLAFLWFWERINYTRPSDCFSSLFFCFS